MKSKKLLFLMLITLACSDAAVESTEGEVISKCRLVRQESSSGFVITHEYHNDGRLIKTISDPPGSDPRTNVWEYDVFGNPKSMLEILGESEESERTFTYGPDSIVSESTVEWFSPAATKYFDYTYNSNDQLIRIDASEVQCVDEYYLFEYTGDNVTKTTNFCGTSWSSVTHSNFDSKINPILLNFRAINSKPGVLHAGIGKNNSRTRLRETASTTRTETVVYTYNDKGLPIQYITTTIGTGIIDPIVETVTLTYECD